MKTEPKYILVIGASAGGFNSIGELIAQLSEEMDMAIFITMHLGHVKNTNSIIRRLQNNTNFICKMAEDGEAIQNKHIYLAVPDKHLLIKKDKILLGTGAEENRWRPSIDTMFRSAASAYNSRVIGIILSGLMQDGTAGMIAIKRCGGTCIVQDPSQVEYTDMPLSVLDNMDVDYCLRLEDIGTVLFEKATGETPMDHPVPDDIKLEAALAERVAINMDPLKELGQKSLFTCPSCNGGLWEMKDGNISRYRCHTGHVFNQDELAEMQKVSLENTLWVALRMMEERRQLLDKMANEENSKGWIRSAAQKSERSKELQVHIERLKQLLIDGQEDTSLTLNSH
jgi:two-component system, chemotaxis family, protein-glutamate methylesterase/glutaminase